MAINPNAQYPTKTNAGSADYPYGSARNITTPGDGTGTPWDQALVNDLFGFQQALLAEASITPSGNPDNVTASDYLDAIKSIVNSADDEYVPLDTGTHALTQTAANTYTYNISEFDWVATGAYTVVPENIRSIHLEAYVFGGNGGTAYVYCTLPDGTETEFSTTANDDGDGANTIPITIPINAGQSTFTIRGLGNAFRFTIHGATQRNTL